MSFFDQIGQGLAYAHQEAVKHITPENINRATQEVWKNVDNAAQQINQHVTPENINRAAEEVRKGLDNAARGLAEAAENARPHVERAVANAGDVLRDAASHVNAENIAAGASIVHEHVNNVALPVGQGIGAAANAVHHHAEEAAAWLKDEENIEAAKEGAQAAAQEAANFAQENPGIVFGLLMIVAPGVVTAPIMGVAKLLGFTSGGVAAHSIASGAQAAIGNVPARGAFATMQSAATGGYGLRVLTTIARAAGGAVIGVGSLGGRLGAWLRGERQQPQSPREGYPTST